MQLMSSLQQEAYNYIKDLILTNRLDVNNLYSETKLSKELGISRTPMREALQCLSQDGYMLYQAKDFVSDSLIRRT